MRREGGPPEHLPIIAYWYLYTAADTVFFFVRSKLNLAFGLNILLKGGLL